MTLELEKADAVGIATAIKASEISAREVLSAALEQIAVHNEAFNCFTAVTADTALADAEQIDKAISQGAVHRKKYERIFCCIPHGLRFQLLILNHFSSVMLTHDKPSPTRLLRLARKLGSCI